MKETKKEIIQFNYDKIVQEKVVVNCKTQEQAKTLLKWADSRGLTWVDKDSYLYETCWERHKELTCYNLFEGIFGKEKEGELVLSYEEALLNQKNPFEEFGFQLKNKVTHTFDYVWQDINGVIRARFNTKEYIAWLKTGVCYTHSSYYDLIPLDKDKKVFKTIMYQDTEENMYIESHEEVTVKESFLKSFKNFSEF